MKLSKEQFVKLSRDLDEIVFGSFGLEATKTTLFQNQDTGVIDYHITFETND